MPGYYGLRAWRSFRRATVRPFERAQQWHTFSYSSWASFTGPPRYAAEWSHQYSERCVIEPIKRDAYFDSTGRDPPHVCDSAPRARAIEPDAAWIKCHAG